MGSTVVNARRAVQTALLSVPEEGISL